MRGYSANGLNQYTSVAGAALGFDASGNLKSDATWSWAYDADNQLRSASRGGTSVSLAYDAAGRLRREVLNAGAATQFLYDGADLVGEYDAAGALLRRYVHGPGVDEPLVAYTGSGTANKEWLYADHLGSVVASANPAGTSTAVYSYGPFGEPNQSAGTRFRYTGQTLMPNLGLYYYKARFYSPTLGRFMQTDPIGFADGLNLYSYVGNGPVNFRDPTGLIAADAKALAGKLGDSVGNWWDASAAGFRSESLGGFANKVLQGLPVGVAAFGVIAKGTAPMASSASIAIAKSINSEAQVAELVAGSYTPIAGAGAANTLRDAPRLVAEYGGKIGDWAKVGATSTYLIRNLPQPAAAGRSPVEISCAIRPISEQSHGSNNRFGELQARFTQPLRSG